MRKPLRRCGCAALIVALAHIIYFGYFWALPYFDIHYPSKSIFNQGFIITVGSTALVFSHGNWENKGPDDGYADTTYAHVSYVGDFYGPTSKLLDSLRSEGIKKVWGSWCFTGNYPYMERNSTTGAKKYWPSWVSRNENPGLTLPIWFGPGIYRLGIPWEPAISPPLEAYERASNTIPSNIKDYGQYATWR